MNLSSELERALEGLREWEAEWGSFARHESVLVDDDLFTEALSSYVERLRGNYPFFHPRYAGQMLKPPHPVAVVGYAAAMLVNPNNHALDGGPPTSAMEEEVVGDIAAMFGFPQPSLGHLTSSGTIANLEAAWVAREIHPGKAIAVSDQAHYTHTRLGDVLHSEVRVIPSDAEGRMQLDALEPAVRSGEIGTIVATAGTTGLGAVDPIADVVEWRDRYGVRVHVDAAYGGFFVLAAGENDEDSPLEPETRTHLRAVSSCDSVAVDPHKHGLQPYGCGCILFRDPAVGRVYRHDSPYTYFTSDELHLGKISFECSRAGAAAGALWLTLRVLPLAADTGLGSILKAGLRAARRWHRRLEDSSVLRPHLLPELDIVSYFPEPRTPTTSAVSAASQGVLKRGMTSEDPVFLSVMRMDADRFTRRHADLDADTEDVCILRSVLMKPEHEHYVHELDSRITNLVAG